jgi:AraC-like DNA-binding protein
MVPCGGWTIHAKESDFLSRSSESKEAAMDVLSEVLSELRLESTLYARFELTAPWAVSYPAGETAAFHVVAEGRCLLEIEGERDPVALEAGDFVVLPHGTAHTLRSPGRHPAAPVATLTAGATPGTMPAVVHGGGGEAARYLCGAFRFEQAHANPVLSALPPLIHVRNANGCGLPWLDMHMAAMACEASSGRAGGALVMARLSDILFVQAVRAHLAALPDEAAGWLGALRDPQIGRALWLIHRHPERPWTVGSLASAVFMSRSSFAERFTRRVGHPPLAYLARWRMYRAGHMLRASSTRLTEVAERLGYASEAAFSTAFKRWAGVSPGAYRRGAPLVVAG